MTDERVYALSHLLKRSSTVEDVMAFGLNRILRKITAQWTDGSFSVSGDK